MYVGLERSSQRLTVGTYSSVQVHTYYTFTYLRRVKQASAIEKKANKTKEIKIL